MARRSTASVIFLWLSDLSFAILSLHLAYIARVRLPWGKEIGAEQAQPGLPVYLLVLVIWSLVFAVSSVYDSKPSERVLKELGRPVVALLMATLVFAGSLYLSYRDVSRLLFVYFFLIDLFLIVSGRILLRFLLHGLEGGKYGVSRVLVVGAGKVGCRVARIMRESRGVGLRLVGFLDDDRAKEGKRFEDVPVLGQLESTCQMVKEHEVDEVVFALPLRAHHKLVNLVIDLQRLPVNVRVVPDFFDLAFFRATTEDFGGVPLINLREPAIDGYQRMVKRALDLIVGAILLVLVAPLMALIAVLIKLDSKGPAIFKQERVSENCKLFQMYKFRSMVPDAEERLDKVLTQTEDGKIIHKVENDPRVTRLGRFLRRTSLDELPQLFNVLKGEMSLVGPRPEMPWLVDRYEPWQLKRFAVPQGITGWWQVHGRSDRPMHLHTEDDLYYIQHYSLLLDIQILFMTIGAVLKRKGAY